MPSCTDEQKRMAVDMVEECGGSVARAMRRLGYPTRQTLYRWPNRRDASRERRAGRPWSHYDPALKAQVVAFVRSGMAGKDVAEMLGVSSAAVACNWARAAEDPSPAAADRSPIEPMRDSEDRAYDGFEGSLEERVRQLELENDILRAAAKVLKAESPSPMTNRERTLVINELRATTGRSSRELTGSLRMSKSSCEHQRAALCRPDKHAGLRARVREAFEGASASRGHRYVTHALRSGDDPVTVSEKAVRRIMREEGLSVAYAKGRARYSSYKGEISDAPENLVTAPSGPQRPMSCGSPTSRSSGCRAARRARPRSSTASAAACPPGRSARARTRSSPTAASRPHAERSARASAP